MEGGSPPGFHVFTIPGQRAMTVKPSALRARANWTTVMFSAALEMEYWMFWPMLEAWTKPVSPAAVLIDIIFFVLPARRRGRKMFVALVTPTTFVWN